MPNGTKNAFFIEGFPERKYWIMIVYSGDNVTMEIMQVSPHCFRLIVTQAPLLSLNWSAQRMRARKMVTSLNLLDLEHVPSADVIFENKIKMINRCDQS